MGSRRIMIVAALAVLAAVLVAFGPAPNSNDNGNTLIVVAPSAPDSIDPGISYMQVGWQLMVNTYDGLLTYPKSGDKDPKSSIPVPDLAVAMPKITDGGKTYSFTMRTGVKFSPPVNREVRPRDIRWAIEREYLMGSPGLGFYSNIIGADKFGTSHKGHISGIVINDKARTIQFRLKAADATFLYVLALQFTSAVPTETPAKDQSFAGGVPSTGPYMFSSYTASRKIVMKRNPNFRSWSPAVPDGNIDGIQVRIGVSPENAMQQIRDGEADYCQCAIPTSRLATFLSDSRLKDQIHIDPTASTSYIFMNTQEPPFNNLKLRQAINWAIDRRAMAKLSGGQAVPDETILPSTMPGYVPHKLYPKQDIAKAKQLVAESGVTPGRIDIWCRTTEPGPTYAVYLQDVMKQLGFTPTVKPIDSSLFFTLIGSKKTHAKIGFANWGQDFPEGSNFIDVLLNGKRITAEHNNNYSMYKARDKEIAKANALQDLGARARAWGRLDTEMMQDAAWAPYSHTIQYSLVSKRLGGYFNHPVYELLFDRVTLKGATKGSGTAPATATGGGAAPAGAIDPTDGTMLADPRPAHAATTAPRDDTPRAPVDHTPRMAIPLPGVPIHEGGGVR